MKTPKLMEWQAFKSLTSSRNPAPLINLMSVEAK